MFSTALLLTLAVAAGAERGSGSGGSDRIDRVSDRTRDVERTRERETRDAREAAERTTKDTQEANDRAVKDQANLTERQTKDAEDAAEREARILEDAVEDAADAAERAAKDAEDAAEDAARDTDNGSSRSLAAGERPDFDSNGFPARRGEVLSLDLNEGEIKRAEAQGFRVLERVQLKALGLKMVRLRAPDGQNAGEAVKQLNAEQRGRGLVDFDHYFAPSSGEVDRQNVLAPVQSRREKTLWVGMIDTAIAPNRAITGLKLDTQNFADGAQSQSHGTAVASILRRAGAARITNANVFSADARPFTMAERIVRALDWLVGRGVPIINVSIAGPQNTIVDRAVAAVAAKGHVVVAAAGNNGPSAPAAFPAASPGAVAVTAVDRQGRIYLRANQGGYVAMAAPGVGIAAATPDGSLHLHSGTSFAAPFVAAHLARCLGKRPGRHANNCITQMTSRARDLGAPGRDPIYGFGLLVE